MRLAAAAALVAAVITATAGAVPAPPRCTKVGTPGADFLVGGSGRDVLCGGAGNDVLAGGNGNDVLRGGPGNDLIEGAAGADTIRAGDGDDVIRAYDGAPDVVDGGRGSDKAWFDPTADRVISIERFP